MRAGRRRDTITLKLEEALESADIDTRSLTKIDWPYTSGFFSLCADGAKAIALWERLRNLTDHSGYWPLIAGEEEHLNALRDNYEMELSTTLESEQRANGQHNSSSELIARAEALDLDLWFESRRFEDPRCAQFDQGAWPADLPTRTSQDLALTHRYHYGVGVDRPSSRVYILLLPATVSWHVPALIRLGGWSQSPQTEGHIAMAKHWYQRYGAEIVAATNNIVEMTVEKPPKTKDESLKLAREQFIYCSDLIHRRYGTLCDLAASLLDAQYWTFWWT